MRNKIYDVLSRSIEFYFRNSVSHAKRKKLSQVLFRYSNKVNKINTTGQWTNIDTGAFKAIKMNSDVENADFLVFNPNYLINLKTHTEDEKLSFNLKGNVEKSQLFFMIFLNWRLRGLFCWKVIKSKKVLTWHSSFFLSIHHARKSLYCLIKSDIYILLDNLLTAKAVESRLKTFRYLIFL